MNISTITRRLLRQTFQPLRIDRRQALAGGERLVAITHIMASAEHLRNQHERRSGGVNDWEVTRSGQPFKGPWLRRAIDRASNPRTTNALHATRIAAAGVLIVSRNRAVRLGADLTLAGVSHLLAPRHHYGADGADQVAALAPVLAAIARLRDKRAGWVDSCLWALSIQGGMSYAFSGFVKLAGERWRHHDAVVGVMRTRTYGNRQAWQVMTRHPWISRVAGVSTLAIECLFCVVFVTRGRLTRPVLIATTGLHLGIAASMGLGRFVPSFLSMYPSIAYVTQPRLTTGLQVGGLRNDLLPKVAGAIGVAGAAGLAIDTARTDRRVRTPRRGDQSVRTASGDELWYRTTDVEDPNAPMVVFENGLLSMPELWHWVHDEVTPRASTLLYDRAGYGPSRVEQSRDFDDVVDDLMSILALAGGRPAIVVGHSLGGYIAHRVAQLRPDLIAGLVLVDSTHPNVLESSVRQQLGSDAMVSSLRLSSWSMTAGMGRFLAVPPFLEMLPADDRAAILDRYRNRRMWETGSREWEAALTDFERSPEPGRIDDVPLTVLTAGDTSEQDERVLELHRELAATSTEGTHDVIDGANHETIIMSQTHAQVVAKHIVRMIDQVEVAS